jgi:hypothetical protein
MGCWGEVRRNGGPGMGVWQLGDTPFRRMGPSASSPAPIRRGVECMGGGRRATGPPSYQNRIGDEHPASAWVQQAPAACQRACTPSCRVLSATQELADMISKSVTVGGVSRCLDLAAITSHRCRCPLQFHRPNHNARTYPLQHHVPGLPAHAPHPPSLMARWQIAPARSWPSQQWCNKHSSPRSTPVRRRCVSVGRWTCVHWHAETSRQLASPGLSWACGPARKSLKGL